MYFWHGMKTKVSIFFFLLLSILFLHKVDKNLFHSNQHAAKHVLVIDNNASSNLHKNIFTENELGAKLTQDANANDDQIDEEDDSFDTKCFEVLQANIFAFLSSAGFTHNNSNNIASIVETQSSRKYILFSVFRI